MNEVERETDNTANASAASVLVQGVFRYVTLSHPGATAPVLDDRPSEPKVGSNGICMEEASVYRHVYMIVDTQ